MGFKMNGSPAKMGTIQGTAGHSSALKMKVEENASALKQKAYGGAGKTWGDYDKASGGALNTDTKTQKEYEAKMLKENSNWDKKKDNTWKTQQNKINKHVGSNVVHMVDDKKAEVGTGGSKNNPIQGTPPVKDATSGLYYQNTNTNQLYVFADNKYHEIDIEGATPGDKKVEGATPGDKKVEGATPGDKKVEGATPGEFANSPNTSAKFNLSKEQRELSEKTKKANQEEKRKTAEDEYGKDSSKYQQERIKELALEKSDRMGGEGGKKQMWGLRQINNLGGNIRTKNALKRGLKARAKEEAAKAAAAAAATT